MAKKKTATRILRNRLVFIFDFDDTIGPSTTQTLFEKLSLDYSEFEKQLNECQSQHWQYALAKAELLRQWSHKENSPIRKAKMEEIGRHYDLFEGAEDFISRLKNYAKEQDDRLELEFVLLTAGFGTIPEATVVADQFDRIYAGELIFDNEGRILGAKRIVTHVAKVHYVKQLKEGLDLDKVSDLEDTYLDHNPQNDYVPMRQIVYIGDGASDMSAFQVVEKGGGIAISIDPDEGKDWLGYEDMAPNRRVHNVAEANYAEESELFQCLKLCIDRAVAEIKLLRFGEGE